MNAFFVPVDFSSNSEVALRYASHLAQAFPGTEIRAHHQMENGTVNDAAKQEATRKKLDDFVRFALSKIDHHENITWTATISSGERLTELIKTEPFQSADLVVMGTKGANGFLKELRGSNTYDVVKNSNIPVLVVPGRASFSPLRHILYCSDFEQLDSFNGLEIVKRLAITFGAEVRIAHIKMSRGHSSTEHTFESQRQATFFEPEVKHAFKIIRHKSVLSGIQYYIDLKRDNQLLVMVKREHGMLEDMFMKNHTREMVFHTHLPLLVIGEK